MVQAVAEFVEQGGQFAVAEQRRGIPHRRRKIAYQVGHGHLQRGPGHAPHPAIVHPGPAAFLRPGIQVEVETGDDLAVPQQFEQARVRVIAVECAGFPHGHPVQALHHREQPRQDPRNGQVGADILLRDLVALFPQLLAVKTHVPGVDGFGTVLPAGKRLQLGPLGLRLGAGLPRQLLEKLADLRRRLRHLGGQGQFREIGKTQQPGLLQAQCQGLLDDGGVVPLACVWSLGGGSGAVGPVDFLPQRGVLAVGQDRIEGREFQGDKAALEARLPRRLPGIGECGRGQALQLLLADLLAPGIGGIQHVVTELAAQFRQALAQLRVLLLLRIGQRHARQAKIPQHVIEGFLLGAIEGSELPAPGELAVGLVLAQVLAAPCAVLGQQWHAGVVSGAKLLAVGHAVKMGHRRPGLGQLVLHLLDRLPQVFPAVLGILCQQRLDRLFVACDQMGDGRLDIRRFYPGERRQGVLFEQGVGHCRKIPLANEGAILTQTACHP